MIYVLVADDNPAPAMLALTAARIDGHYDYVGDRAALLSALRAWVPDALVLDLSLPGVTDPRAFAAEVRALFAGRIVVASGLDRRVVCQIADSIGAHPLPKPHLAAQLVAAVTGDTP